MVVAFEGNMFAVVFEPALVAFADDKDDMEAVRIPAAPAFIVKKGGELTTLVISSSIMKKIF